MFRPPGASTPGGFFPARQKNSKKTMDIFSGIVYTAIKHHKGL